MFVMWCILPFCILINGISSEYDPLDTNGIPESYDRTLPTLTCQQVADKLRKAKKSMSMVPGDTNPLLYNRHASRLAVPITSIYNAITQSKSWPISWKVEYVTVIPKHNAANNPSECRNISCTNFLSKIYESFTLE